ncbi:hypothetical protein LJC72_13250 [Bacteroides sp. OttesenSCG-928-D19]|nr:hypothetical protein [Bacteroides sp. OttesenSCG-928-D19]
MIDLFKIEIDTPYLKKIIPHLKKNTILQNKVQTDGIDYLLKECKSTNKILSLKLIYQDYISGSIISYDNNYVVIKTYTQLGEYRGKSIVKYEDIQNLAFERKEEKIISKLMPDS